MVKKIIPCDIKVTPSNDPRSYHVNSDKLLATGFRPKKTIGDAVLEIKEKHLSNQLVDDEKCYNVKTMKKLLG